MPRTPPVRLRRLAAELKRLRETAGLTQEQVTDQTGASRASLFRIENARGRAHRQLVVTLLDLYKASDAERAELLALHKTANQDGWLVKYRDALPGEYPAYIQFEAEATAVSNYEGQAVPGLLQTADYARAVLVTGLPKLTESEVEKRVEARMTRQQVLRKDKPLQLWVIIDEAVVRRKVGGRDVMRAQLEKLMAEAQLPHVELQVLPYDVGAHVGMPGSFAMLEFAEPYSPFVYLEHMGGDVFLDSKSDVARFRAICDHLRATALSPDQSLRFLLQSL